MKSSVIVFNGKVLLCVFSRIEVFQLFFARITESQLSNFVAKCNLKLKTRVENRNSRFLDSWLGEAFVLIFDSQSQLQWRRRYQNEPKLGKEVRKSDRFDKYLTIYNLWNMDLINKAERAENFRQQILIWIDAIFSQVRSFFIFMERKLAICHVILAQI